MGYYVCCIDMVGSLLRFADWNGFRKAPPSLLPLPPYKIPHEEAKDGIDGDDGEEHAERAGLAH